MQRSKQQHDTHFDRCLGWIKHLQEMTVSPIKVKRDSTYLYVHLSRNKAHTRGIWIANIFESVLGFLHDDAPQDDLLLGANRCADRYLFPFLLLKHLSFQTLTRNQGPVPLSPYS